MPLHADDPVFMRLVLDRFDHTVGATAATRRPWPRSRTDWWCEVLIWTSNPPSRLRAGKGRELGDFAARLDPRGMDGISRIRRKTFPAVFDVGVQFAGDV